jgi:hypothetical protein
MRLFGLGYVPVPGGAQSRSRAFLAAAAYFQIEAERFCLFEKTEKQSTATGNAAAICNWTNPISVICLMTLNICYELEMSDTSQERTTIGVRFPVDVRRAIDRAAERELCSASDIVRRFTLEGLRRTGLLEERST